jgi:hypothetical protein
MKYSNRLVCTRIKVKEDIMQVGEYVVTSKTGDSKWHETSAKTLKAAKTAASKMYQQSVGGTIEVGMPMDEFSVTTVAVKRGLDKWVNI